MKAAERKEKKELALKQQAEAKEAKAAAKAAKEEAEKKRAEAEEREQAELEARLALLRQAKRDGSSGGSKSGASEAMKSDVGASNRYGATAGAGSVAGAGGGGGGDELLSLAFLEQVEKEVRAQKHQEMLQRRNQGFLLAAELGQQRQLARAKKPLLPEGLFDTVQAGAFTVVVNPSSMSAQARAADLAHAPIPSRALAFAQRRLHANATHAKSGKGARVDSATALLLRRKTADRRTPALRFNSAAAPPQR